MLLEFAITNFRSIGAEQRLSMSAGRFKRERSDSVIATGSRICPLALRAMAIMGPNGAGKSTIVLALSFLQDFVSDSAKSKQMGERIDVVNFRLDDSFSQQPSMFELGFVHDEVEYHYSVALNSKRIEREILLHRTRGASLREAFSRVSCDGDYKWNLGTLPPDQAELWKKSTRPNALFLSTAVQLNSSELAPPFEWITKRLRIQTAGGGFSASHTAHLIQEHKDDGCRTEVLNLLREADLGIRDVIIKEEKFDEASVPEDMPEELRSKVISTLRDQTFLRAQFQHRSRQMKPVIFDFDDESDGTQRLFEMAGPWITSLRHDYTLVVDEIDQSLHSYIVRMLVSMFQSPDRTASKAQLIFTTHDNGLMDSGILERDQFYLVEKRRGQSELIPLSDYKPRRSEAIRLNYLRGRYGAVPAITRVDR